MSSTEIIAALLSILSRCLMVPRRSLDESRILSNEDIRRSLEVLDSVLAEFDDNDIFSGVVDEDEVVQRDERRLSEHDVTATDRCDSATNRISNNSSVVTTAKYTNGHCQERPKSSSLKSVSTDGAPSQAAVQLHDECRRYSPPPVPRRSPTTRLSNRDDPFFPKENLPKDSRPLPNGLHDLALKSTSGCDPASKTSTLSSSEEIGPNPKNALESPVSYLSGCDEITDGDACAFRANLCIGDDDVVDDVFASAVLQESGHVCPTSSVVCRACGKVFVADTSSLSPCDTKSRMETSPTSAMSEALRRRLDRKFVRTKQLLKLNLITGLDAKPPSRRPPPPPEHKKWVRSRSQGTRAAAGHNASIGDEAALAGVQMPSSGDTLRSIPPNNVAKRLCSSNDSVHFDTRAARNTLVEVSPAVPRDSVPGESVVIKNHFTENLCDSCSKRKPPIGALSNALQRPPLGLSYSMEDDLSPGVKEIRSSTPKPDYDQDDAPSCSPKESPVVHMSTFSRSLSSLGDGSSQSDSDISLSQESGKVPLTSIRSLTLPTDMKLGPSLFYSAAEEEHDGSGSKFKGRNVTHGCDGLIPEEMRSSSAPPPPPSKGHWRKDSKKLNKNERENRNDSVDWARPEVGDEDTVVEKPKKRGIWKSILRRK